MTIFLWNVFLAFVWAFALGDFELTNLALGFALGYVVLWLSDGAIESGRYCGKVPRLVEFVLLFVWELLVANLRVAYDVLTPTHRMRPGILAFPLDARTDGEITLLANLISLTPGTLSLDVSPDRKMLFIHTMYIEDVEREKRRIKQGLERRLLGVLR